jgi:hypothetical protein
VSDDTALLSRLTWILADEPAANTVARRVCLVLRDLLQADGAAITMEPSTPHRVTLCATDKRADLLENFQDVLGEGPGMDAFDSGQPVRAALDQPAAARWPHFIPAAAGVVSWHGLLWSIPMCTASQVIGVVSMYRLLRGPPGDPLGDAQLLADVAASSLAQDPSAHRTITESASEDCWSSRAVVHQATGMLVAQLRVSAEEALARLRRYAFASRRHLTEVARDVVERRLTLAG